MLAAHAWLLIDHASDQVLAAERADQKIEPASLTKIMTSYLAYAALRDGRIKPDQVVPVSEAAWKAPGSRMFIDPKNPVTIDALLSGVIIQSGNDASIALAEAIAGSEIAFAGLMNAEAQRLGMLQTHFVNATGLPDAAHLTTAGDLARLTRALIRDYPEEYKRYAEKGFVWNKIKQPNRNRLLWLDAAVDGVKTGHTESAGYCLVASRQEGGRRLTAVVLGTASEQARIRETQTLLQYGYRAFDSVKLYDAGQALAQPNVFKGAQASIGAGFEQPLMLSLPKGLTGPGERLKTEIVHPPQPLVAPLKKGETIARLRLTVDGKHFGEYPLVALADVPAAGIFGRMLDSIKLWLQ